MTSRTDRFLPYVVLLAFCLVSLWARPILPPDESRYLTASWEMWLSKSWFVPTVNFAPYHHKPPLLFWLINLAWALFGVGRLGVMAVMFAISSVCLHLTWRLSRALFPGRDDIARRVPWLMLGSAPFLIYSSLVLFDLMLTATILAAFLGFLAFARGGGLRYAMIAGLFIGLGVLTKGPVVLIHLVWPVALYAVWRSEREVLSTGGFLRGAALALLFALIPLALWLIPALVMTDGNFAYALIWEQSAGRISGNMEQSHPRPFYFYLMLLPLLGMPWLLSPSLWRQAPIARLRRLRHRDGQDVPVLRLLLLWSLGVLAAFSLISGKQPHYLVPILPLAILVFAWLMADVSLAAIRRGAVAVALLFAAAQGVAAGAFFPRYDLAPVTAFMAERPAAPFGYVGTYSGEFGYLARLRRPLDVIEEAAASAWFSAHPDGFLIDYIKGTEPPPAGREIRSMAFRSGRLAILAAPGS